jgi:hypothetical protein
VKTQLKLILVLISLLLFSNPIPQSQYIEPINEQKFWDVKVFQSNSSLPLLLQYENMTYFPQDGVLACHLNLDRLIENDTIIININNGTFRYENIHGSWDNLQSDSFNYENYGKYKLNFTIYPANLNILFFLTISLNQSRTNFPNYLENHTFYIVGTPRIVWVGQDVFDPFPFDEIYLNALMYCGIVCATLFSLNLLYHQVKKIREHKKSILEEPI